MAGLDLSLSLLSAISPPAHSLILIPFSSFTPVAIAMLLIRHYVKLRLIMRSNSSSSGHTSGQHSSRKVILRNKGEMSGVNLALTFRVGLYVLCVLLALV